MLSSSPNAVRIPAIDVARGVAIVAMIAYHTCWDLTYFGLARLNLFADGFWLVTRDVILAAFLLLVGLGLTLATGEGVCWRRVAKRTALIGGAAAAITLASLWFAPDAVIFFGALHHIALTSVLGLAFIRLPGWAVLAVAAVCLVAPGFLAAPLFDQDWLRWVGLGTLATRSNDYVPLLPWFGLVLAGLVLGRRLESLPGLAGWRPEAPPMRGLEWAGRHSLLVYLVHQPLLLGAMALLAVAGSSGPVAGTTPAAPLEQRIPVGFQAECRGACEKSGGNGPQCVAYCRCVDAKLTENALWPSFLNERLSQAGQRRVLEIVQMCAANRTER